MATVEPITVFRFLVASCILVVLTPEQWVDFGHLETLDVF